MAFRGYDRGGDREQGRGGRDDENREVGALWRKEGRNGDFWTGTLHIEGREVDVIMFENANKQNPKSPDFRILRSRPRDEEPAGQRRGGYRDRDRDRDEARPARRYETSRRRDRDDDRDDDRDSYDSYRNGRDSGPRDDYGPPPADDDGIPF